MSKQTFTGFPQEGLQFLADLAQNNNREWFQTHKQMYLDTIVAPAQAFVLAIGEGLQSISSGIRYDTRTNGSGSLMRIYRDVRFSKDKTPYKTNVGIVWWEGNGKKTEEPGFYFGLDSSGAGTHAGLHGFSKGMLHAYRDAVVDDSLGNELAEILNTITQNGRYTLSAPHYKRTPRGYDAENPRADLLLYNGLYASAPTLPEGIITSPELVDVCLEQFRHMVPLQQWLGKVRQTASG